MVLFKHINKKESFEKEELKRIPNYVKTKEDIKNKPIRSLNKPNLENFKNNKF